MLSIDIIEQARQMGAVERTFINQVVAADKNLAYHYCYEDTPESQSVTIVISTDELRDIIELILGKKKFYSFTPDPPQTLQYMEPLPPHMMHDT